MEVLASSRVPFFSNTGQEEQISYGYNVTKLSKCSEITREDAGDISYHNKGQDNVEPKDHISLEHKQSFQTSLSVAGTAVEKDISFDRDQSQIQYLLTKLPVLAEHFHVHRKVGEGTFSSVFLGTLKNVNTDSKHVARQFAIKHLVPTTLPSRTERELQCLQDIGGSDNVSGIDLCLRQGDCVVFIMPYLPHKRFSDYMHDMTVSETRDYMLNLFIALRRVHSFNIIHRDIKPSNFLYDRENKKFLLVDFGLAQSITTDFPATDTSNSGVALQFKRKKHEEVNKDTLRSPFPGSTQQHKKRKREEDDKNSSVSLCADTPDLHKRKRLALQPRTNENNISHNYISSENIVLSPSRSKVLGVKNENTPPNSKKTPRRRMLHEGMRSPLKDQCVNMKHSAIKKKLFSAGSPRVTSNIHSGGPKFQTLAPEIPNGPSFVRVQNSQVKSHLVSPPLSSQQQQQKLVFSRPSPVTQVHSKTPVGQQCHCYGKPQICSVCMIRKMQAAPRAGTPGFRPPEVLLKYPLQTTAVDMWAAGIIFLCILSGCYPFFRSPDDLSALAEIMSVFGTEGIKKLASKLGRCVTCSVEKRSLNLKKLCERLRRHRKAGRPSVPPGAPICPDCTQVIDSLDGCLCRLPGDSYDSPSSSSSSEAGYPSSAYSLLERLLDLNPETRITASEAMEHPFVKGL